MHLFLCGSSTTIWRGSHAALLASACVVHTAWSRLRASKPNAGHASDREGSKHLLWNIQILQDTRAQQQVSLANYKVQNLLLKRMIMRWWGGIELVCAAWKWSEAVGFLNERGVGGLIVQAGNHAIADVEIFYTLWVPGVTEYVYALKDKLRSREIILYGPHECL